MVGEGCREGGDEEEVGGRFLDFGLQWKRYGEWVDRHLLVEYLTMNDSSFFFLLLQHSIKHFLVMYFKQYTGRFQNSISRTSTPRPNSYD